MSNNYKVVFVGDSSVGKTSIIYWLQNKMHKITDFDATIGASFAIVKMNYKINEVKLHIWDTAGQERYRSLIKIYYRNSVCCICVFDVTNLDSYRHVSYWLDEYTKYNINKHFIYLFANKCDIPETMWQITKDDINKFAQEKNIKLYYTSAINGKNIEIAFKNITKDLCKDIYDSIPELSTINHNKSKCNC